MRFKIYVLIVLFIFVRQSLFAQRDAYKFSHLDITNGLSDNQVNCIFKDKEGFMWFGTTSGLNRYDGYKFRVFKHDPKDPYSLGENHVLNICEGPENELWIFTHSGLSIYNSTTEKFNNNIGDLLARYKVSPSQITLVKKGREGDFWFITQNSGLYHYYPTNKATVFYSTLSKNGAVPHSNYISDIQEDKNYIWLVYNDGVIERLDKKANKVGLINNQLAIANNFKPQHYITTIDSQSNLWIYSDSGTIGAYCYNTIQNTLLHFSKDQSKRKLNSNVVNSIIQGDDNKIWMGTDHGGINIWNPASHKFIYLLSKEDDANSLSGNSVSLYKDNSGIIWAGTFKQGLNYYHSGIMQFPLYKHFATDTKSLPFEDVNCFEEDSRGDLWIGTNGGGLIYYDRAANVYTQYRHDPANINSLSNDIVTRLCIDHENKLWIGTYFGGLDCLDQGKFIHHIHNDKIPGSITDDRVYSILEDKNKNLWVGTFSGGLNIYDRNNNIFLHPKYSLSSDYTSIIYQDKQQNVWIGRDRGVDMIEKKTGLIKHYTNSPNNPNSLVANDVNNILEDGRGLIWIGTKAGLSILNPKTDKFLNRR